MATSTHAFANGEASLPLARTLGWLSVGLGAAALLAPRGLARWAGVNGARGRIATATAAIAGLTALDLLWGTQLRQSASTRTKAEHVRATIRIRREPQHLYRFWRELQNLPRFIQRLEAVAIGSDGRSRWRAIGPGGTPVEWKVELIADEADRRIAWCSVPDAEVFHCGSVRFEPARAGGTFVRMDLQCAWPGTGWMGRAARILGAGLEQEMKEDLRRFKQLMETGEIATTEGQSSGRTRRRARG